MNSTCALSLLQPRSADAMCMYGTHFGWVDEAIKQSIWLAKRSGCQGIYDCCGMRVRCWQHTRLKRRVCNCSNGDPETEERFRLGRQLQRKETQWFTLPRNYTYELVVAAIFRNEAGILGEWVAHHTWQGVQHFFLISNNSTDGWVAALRPFAALVTLFSEPESHEQTTLLSRFVLPLVRQCARWVLHIDIDERPTVLNRSLHSRGTEPRPFHGHSTAPALRLTCESATSCAGVCLWAARSWRAEPACICQARRGATTERRCRHPSMACLWLGRTGRTACQRAVGIHCRGALPGKLHQVARTHRSAGAVQRALARATGVRA